MMDRYSATLDYLYNRLPMFQRTGPAAYKNSLENTLLLDDMYGSPHRHYPTLHIAGTNGKGSVSHLLAAVLQSAGFRCGLYTSPHLKDFRERIRINGKVIPRAEVIRWVEAFRIRNQTAGVEPSFFELTAAMAFDFFARKKVDIAVIETGLGGRLDSTNIINPLISVITNISYDHVPLLGTNLEQIAGEKAGIIKPGIPVVISQYQPETADVFRKRAEREGAPLFFAGLEYQASYSMKDTDGKQILNFRRHDTLVYKDLKTDLPGLYQRFNIPAVLKSVELLRESGWKIPDKAVYRGLSEVTTLTGLQGRWQIIGHNPLIVCDTGHNEDGIREVVSQIRQTPHRKLHFVLGVVADKDVSKILPLLPKEATYYFTKANIPRAMEAGHLRDKAAESGLLGESYPKVRQAFEAAKAAAQKEDLVFVGGSNFVVAEIL